MHIYEVMLSSSFSAARSYGMSTSSSERKERNKKNPHKNKPQKMTESCLLNKCDYDTQVVILSQIDF